MPSTSSTPMLNSLDIIKDKEFGSQKITLKDIPQLQQLNPSPSRMERNKRKRSTSRDLNLELETPKKQKINGQLSRDNKVPDDSMESLELSKNAELKLDVSSVSDANRSKKVKAPNEADRETERAKQVQFLQRFVNISLRYSEYLDNKIATSRPSSSSSPPEPSNGGVRRDIAERLNFFTGELRPYQMEGVTWLTILFENTVNGILADEMGLGKTIQIIALFCHLYERKVNGPFLIVAPLSTLGNWESEFKRFAPDLPVIRLQGNAEERDEQKRRIRHSYSLNGRTVKPIVICSYQIPLMENAFLQMFTWQYLVVDEGHRIKNSESQLSKELRQLKSINRSLLTGTPLQNNLEELWALFHFLMPDMFKDEEAFSRLLDLDDVKDTDKLLQDEAKSHVISTIHQVLAPFMLRREKKSVLPDIVPKKEVIVYCSLTEMQNYLYRATLQGDMKKLFMENAKEEEVKGKRRRSKTIKFSQQFDDDDQVDLAPTKSKFVRNKENIPLNCPDGEYMCYVTMQNTMMMLKKVVNHPYLVWCPLKPDTKAPELLITDDIIKQSGKLLVLDALLPKLKKRGHKVLIFTTLVMFMDMIEEMLIMREYSYRRLDGGVNYDDRIKSIDDFMTDSEVFIFLVSTRAGGLGLNLTAADTVIFMDRDWNPMVDSQAQDRCHRIGQTKPVVIYSLIAKGTIDEAILSRGDMKRRLEKIVLKEGKFKTIKKHFSENELKDLEDMLNNEEKLMTIHANGLIYTDNELNQILDRSDLIEALNKQLQKNKGKGKSKSKK